MEVKELQGRLAETGGQVRVKISGGRIVSVAPVPGPEPDEPDKRDESGLWIAPGLIDLQINGFAGHDLNAADVPLEARVETVCRMTREVLKTGTTSFCPTIITAGFEQIRDAVRAIRLACERDPLVRDSVIGIHLEGPYISGEDGPRGAHPKDQVRDPDWDEFAAWQEAAGGLIRMVTLAPERKGAVAMIRRLAAEGILVCIGHTAASHEDIAAAADAGARLSTHLGNGAHPLLPRHPNYIWSQLADDRLTPGIIADGHHLHPSVVKVMSRAKNGRVVLVSDAAHLAGMAPGRYKTHIGGEVELLPTGRLQMAAPPHLLAGSAVSLADCVERYREFLSCPLGEAIRAAAGRPAELIGEPLLGEIGPGRAADLIAFTREQSEGRLHIRKVIKSGRIVWEAGNE